MEVSIKDLAKNNNINPLALERFAKKMIYTNKNNHYGFSYENNELKTTTLFAQKILDNFKYLNESNYLQIEDLLLLNVDGWKPIHNMDTLMWTDDKSNINIFATPNYSDDKYVLFEVYDNNEPNSEPDVVLTITFFKAQTIQQQIDWYVDALKTVIKHWTY
jgi:hypothetical protein